jgi:DNA-binding PadR family transcriptional regulator
VYRHFKKIYKNDFINYESMKKITEDNKEHIEDNKEHIEDNKEHIEDNKEHIEDNKEPQNFMENLLKEFINTSTLN